MTGNMGYIGPLVISEIRNKYKDAYIVGLDNCYFAHCLIDPRESLPEKNLDEQIFLDIRDLSIEKLRGVDVIIHLAAISNDPMGNIYESQTWEINSLASQKLAEMAKVAGVKSFVFASSCSIYGEGGENPRDEFDKLSPLTTYAKSKVFFEEILAQKADENFKVTCLRFATACGWSPRCRFDLVLNDFVLSAMTFKKISVLSDGSPWRPMIHVKDMAKAIVWAIEREKGGYFLKINTGNNKNNFQVRDLAEIVALAVPNTNIEIAKQATPDKRSYKVNFSLIEELGPDELISWSVKDAVINLYEKLKEVEFKQYDFRSSQYIRFNTLKKLQLCGELDSELRWK